MKRFKKIISEIMVCVMAATIFPVSSTKVYAAEQVVDNLKYTVSNGTATITGYEVKPEGELTIPSTIVDGDTTLTVTAIGNNAFRGCSDITKVTLPDSITTIDVYAFVNCNSLNDVNFEEVTSLETIKGGAFYNTALTEITMPSSVKLIDGYNPMHSQVDGAFEEIDTLLKVDLSNISSAEFGFGLNVFENCDNLNEVKLPSNLESIPGSVFAWCPKLTTIHLPESLINIGREAFAYDTSLDNVTFPSKLETIDFAAFWGTGLTSIVIPENVKSIGKKAFSHCNDLTSVDISAIKSDTLVAENVFSDCEKLSDVKLSADMSSIPYGMFENDVSLKNISIPNGIKTIGKYSFNKSGLSGTLTLAATITEIDEYAFRMCPIEKLDISNLKDLETIRHGVFSACTSLTEVVWPQNADKFHIVNGFDGCSALNDNTIASLPESVTTIVENAFARCGFKEITIPASIVTIEKNAFDYCNTLSDVAFEKDSRLESISGFSQCYSLKDDVVSRIPSSVTEIGERAFYGDKFTKINIPEGVENIGFEAFKNIYSAIEIVIPSSAKTIGKEAFYNNTGINTIEIKEGLKSIGSNAFYMLGSKGNLFDIYVPASVETIDSKAFTGIGSTLSPVDITFANKDVCGMETDANASDFVYNDNYVVYDIFYNSHLNVYGMPLNSDNNTSYLKALYDYNYTVSNDANCVYKYEEISSTSINNTIIAQVPKGAKVTITSNNKVKYSNVLSDGKLKFHALGGVKTAVNISLDGYYDLAFMKNADEFTSNWNLGNITLDKFKQIEQTNTMQVNLSTVSGNINESFHSFTYELYCDGKALERNVDYMISKPYIYILNDTIKGSDKLHLTVKPDESMTLSEATVSSTLDNGSFDVILEELGDIEITVTGEFSGNNQIIVFDSKGNICNSYTTSNDTFISDKMKAGTYRMIAFNSNQYFDSVSSESALSNLGFVNGKDYTVSEVEVINNNTGKITLDVPVMSTEGFTSIINDKGNSLFVDSSQIVNLSFYAEINYSFASADNNVVRIFVPSDCVVDRIYNYYEAKETVCEAVGFNKESKVIDVPVKSKNGKLYVYLTALEEGNYSILASGINNSLSAPIGNGSFTVRAIKVVNSTAIAAKKNCVAYVYTAPKTKVNLIVEESGKVYTGNTNALGKATISYDLPDDVYDGQDVTVTVTAETGTASTDVSYYDGYGSVDSLAAYQGPNKFQLIKDGRQSANYYTYISDGTDKYKNWTFIAKVKSKYHTSDTANLLMQMMDGSIQVQQMKKTATKESDGIFEYTYTCTFDLAQVGDHIFDSSFVPSYFNVIYDVLDFVEVQSKKDDSDILDKKLKAYTGPSINAKETLEYFINKDYRLSDKEYFHQLPSETQSFMVSFETAMEEYSNLVTKSLGLTKNVTEYRTVDEICSEMGIYNGAGVTYSSDKIQSYKEEGYRVLPDSKIAYKVVSAKEVKPVNDVKVDDSVQYYEIITEEGISWNSNRLGFTTESDADISVVTPVRNAISGLESNIAADHQTDKAVIAKVSSDVESANEIFCTLNKSLYEDTDTQVSYSLLGQGSMIKEADKMNQWIHLERIRAEQELQRAQNELAKIKRKYPSLTVCISLQEDYVQKCQKVCDVLNNNSIGKGATVIAEGFSISKFIAIKKEFDEIKYKLAEAKLERANSMAKIHSLSYCYSDYKPKRDITYEEALRIVECLNKGIKVDVKLDPSGIVYEAVTSNTLSDVTATIYYSEESDGSNAVVWDAQPYDEINPQITNITGAYAWDVPEGYYQVRFTKEGYEDAATEWLPVPPIQVNLKTAMISKSAPAILSAHAYPEYTVVVFSQYMDASMIPAVTGGTAVWTDVEEGYSKVLHINNAVAKKSGDTVDITISGAKNYAGKSISKYSKSLKVIEKPEKLILNYDSQISLGYYQSDIAVTARVVDANGNGIEGIRVSAGILNSDFASITAEDGNVAITDADGIAKFMLATLDVPMATSITFDVVGANISKSIPLLIDANNKKSARVVVKVGDKTFDASSPKENYITVEKGTKMTLSCDTEGAVIYYTTDNTCPCQNTAGRYVYKTPIILDKNIKIRIASYADGFDYSDRTNITVTVKEKTDEKPTPAPEPVQVSATSIQSLENTGTYIKITYKKVSGVSGYYIYRKSGKGSFEMIADTTNTSYSDKKAVKNGTEYQYKIVAYKEANGEKITAEASEIKSIIRLSNASLKSKKVVKKYKTSKVIKFTFARNKYATGYQIKYTTGKKTVTKKTKKLSLTLKKVSGKKVYIRCYKTVGGKTYTSAWKKVKI